MFKSFAQNVRTVIMTLLISITVVWVSAISLNYVAMFKHRIVTSKECKIDNKAQRRNKFEINIRAMVGFRDIGKGFDAIQNFS